MEVFLGRSKVKKPMQLPKSSLSTTSSCFLSGSNSNSSSTLPFPILFKEDFTECNSDHDDNNNDGINSCEQFTFQAVLLNGAKTLITDLEQIKILRKRVSTFYTKSYCLVCSFTMTIFYLYTLVHHG